MKITTNRTLTLAAGTLLFSASSHAAVTLSQGFENAPFTDGATIGAAAVGDDQTVGGGWHTNNPGNLAFATLPTVTTDQAHSGNQSLEITRSFDANDNEVNIELYGQNQSADTASVTNVATSFYIYLTSQDATAQFMTGFSLGSENPGFQIRGNGELRAYETGHDLTLLQTGLDTDKWYGIKIETDLAAKTYDVYLDDGSGGGFVKMNTTALSQPNLSATGISGAVTFKPKGPDGASFYVDDIQVVTAVPEPGSLALLGIGGLLMWRRGDGIADRES